MPNFDFANKVSSRRSSLGMTQKQLGEAMGVSITTIQNYESGQMPRWKNIELLANALKCSADWLVSETAQPQQDHIPGTTKMVEPQADMPEFTLVPKSRARLNAGGGSVVYDESVVERYAFRKDWLSRRATSATAVTLLDVDGDSMEPSLPDGCTVMVDMGRKEVVNGAIYAIAVWEMIMVKRLELTTAGVRVISDNRASGYDPFHAKPDEIRIIGRVIWAGIEM